jgi:hypothetical protein
MFLALVIIQCVSSCALAADYISEKPAAGYFPLVQPNAMADIFVAEDDWKVAQIAATNLMLDVERVTGRRPALKHSLSALSSEAVLIGTIGRSRVIDDLICAGRVAVSGVRGQWEACATAMVTNPLPGVARALVIAGSDRRGTAYAVFELSRRIGVSPWVWWADVTPQHRDALHVSPVGLGLSAPVVKYRGIFINDEMWGIREWASKTLAPDEGLGLGPKTYAKVCELLLRLRANYLWPAMQSRTKPFNDYPQNKVVADDYAIIMGSSHIEPMLRNNMRGAEWDSDGHGDWDYTTNAKEIRDYWARRLEANGKYENVYTLGMRGRDDEPMKGGANKEEKIALLEKIFADQRELLARYVSPDPTQVPQVFIPYTEVLGLYDAGMKVPDDVTICWPDDNFGYIRRLPTTPERARSGGSGIYYHIQWLNGATTAYTWLNTTPPALMWEELNKAWQYGATRLWVLNVGDIKPGEIGLEFFFDMAWAPQRWRHDNLRSFLEQWAARDLDAKAAPEIAVIMEEHFRLGFTRRPEHLVQFRRNEFSYSWFSHDNYHDEAQQRLDRYVEISRRAQAVYDQLPRERKDAFFQLVLYPVQCAALLNEKVICADKNRLCADRGSAAAAEYARRARAAAARIIELTAHYNTGLLTVSNKWHHMMSPAPGPWGAQAHQFEMPSLKDFDGSGPPTLDVITEGGGKYIVSDLSVYTQGRRFVDLFNKGKGEINWKATVSMPWLKLDRTEGRFTTEQRVWVSLDWAAAPKGTNLEPAIDIESSSGKQRVTVPIFNPAEPARDTVTGFVESHGYVSMESEHFTRRRAADGAAWEVVKGLGRSGNSVTVIPATVASYTEPAEIRAHSPALEYDFHLFKCGEFQLHLHCLPTQPVAPRRGTRLAISLDGSEPHVLGDRPRPTSDVLTNLRRFTTTVTIAKPGPHTLTVWMVDPGVVLDKIVLYTAAPKDSYLGPLESFRGGAARSDALQENVIALAGTWRFRLDPRNTGIEGKWFAEKLDDLVKLPGTTDTNQKGELKDERAVDRLSRVWYWKGPAWYQREVVIPESWQGKRITLLLERTKTTRVWVEDQDCGAEDTLSAPQIFDLTRALTPGRHTITVLVDNAKLPPVGPSHAVDERTQSNWNGIVGKLELHATDPVWIEDAQVYPEAAKKQARVRLVIGNLTGQPAGGQLTVGCRSCNVAAPAAFKTQSVVVQAPERRSVVEFTCQPGEAVALWDEFQPALLRLELKLVTSAGGQSFTDQQEISFGLRDFRSDGRRLAINDRTVFLRGRVDSANYPLTGYPPMDKDGWRRVLGILKDWGLNHVRFHSWCPPEAAFEAADELGMYFQVEFPNKSSAFKAPESSEAAHWNIDYLDRPATGTHVPLYDYARRECELIFRHFGNHPSFVMFTLGNELGRNPAMFELVSRFHECDQRHLYAQGSGNMHWAPSFAAGDDFWVTGKTGKNLPVRGAFFVGDFPGGGYIDAHPPSTLVDYRDSIKDAPAPVIGHEIAEFEVTPDFGEIPKYTGVMRARNLEIFQQRLKDAHMLDLEQDFIRASGALAAICQREEIEAALRTPGFGGFQWLDIQDFPGQGTALVGMLNDFLENKGITTPEHWRQFCCETVPLLLMPKYTWTTDETFVGEVKAAHYGAADIRDAHVNWTLLDGETSPVAWGTLGPLTITQGGLRFVGQIRALLNQIKAPRQVKLTIAIAGTQYRNTYDLWVYPSTVDTSTPKGVLVTNRLDATTLKFLTDGGKVLLFSPTNDAKHSVGGAFTTDFWCWPMFAKAALARKMEPAPGTQGFLCDPNHPALAEFPTEFHSNWQWWQIVKHARPIILDETPADYRPIIHVIDNFARNHKLGLLFETKVGPGKLLVCASDLPALQAHPEARQLMHSLVRYVGSDRFKPAQSVDLETLRKIL